MKRKHKEVKPVKYAYGLTSALLVGGAAISLATGQPAGAQVAQNDESRMAGAVPRAGAPESFADLTAQLQPAVVNISTTQRVEVQSANPFAGTPFEGLFGSRGGGSQEPQYREGQSLGSGFVISADGYIVTNNHVIAPAGRATVEQITVTMPDGTEYPAELVGADRQSDLAVLKISRDEPFPFVEFGDSEHSRVGDWVVAIGNPFGLGGTVTSGIISAVYRTPPTGGVTGAYDRYIQTDASINRGNSGGPLFDMQGNVIGINNAIISPTGGSVGIGFAIPADIAAPIVAQLRRGERVERGYLGVSLGPVNDDIADSVGLDRSVGEFVQIVRDGDPAARAGIQPGDIIVEVGGETVTNDRSVSYIVANTAPGTTLPVTLYRNGERRTVNVTVGQFPTDEALAQEQEQFDLEAEPEATDEPQTGAVAEQLGLQVMDLTPAIARQLRAPAGTQGVVIAAVDRGSDAGQKVTRGDIILSANYNDVATAADLERIVREAQASGREAVLLRIQRVGAQSPFYVPIRLR
ncbi:Do family serine endopeptidase [Pelagerythrobacter sp.]|uniref:Do family serine endopeptidase n=1 Tax=Pelagerythrobacter sp. TaxID=2800702 RepID=UPI0035B2DACC